MAGGPPEWIKDGVRVWYQTSLLRPEKYAGVVAGAPRLLNGTTWVVSLRGMDSRYREGKRSTVPAAACNALTPRELGGPEGIDRMLPVLIRAERALSDYLGSANGWQSLDVDYEPPQVKRLWRPFEDIYRLYLHKIYPCQNALYHPHPWPSAVKIVSGMYKTGIGYGPGDDPPPIAVTFALRDGSSYEMVNPDAWHYVHPVYLPSLSIMVTGPKWDRKAPQPTRPLNPLSPREIEELLEAFRSHYVHD